MILKGDEVITAAGTVLHRTIQSVPHYPYFPVTTRIDGMLETTLITRFTQFPDTHASRTLPKT